MKKYHCHESCKRQTSPFVSRASTGRPPSANVLPVPREAEWDHEENADPAFENLRDESVCLHIRMHACILHLWHKNLRQPLRRRLESVANGRKMCIVKANRGAGRSGEGEQGRGWRALDPPGPVSASPEDADKCALWVAGRSAILGQRWLAKGGPFGWKEAMHICGHVVVQLGTRTQSRISRNYS